VVMHITEDEMGETLAGSRAFAAGECKLRARDPEFCERYFGPAGLWGRRLAYRPEVARSILAALIAGARRNPRDAAWLARESVARLPAGVAGLRPRRTWERVTAGLHSATASFPLLPRKLRWRSFVAAQDRTVAATQLGQGAEQNGPSAPHIRGIIGAEALDGVLVGAHGLEQDGSRPFRWTEPVALLRVAQAEDSVLRIRTGGLRQAPLDYLQGIYVASDSLPAEMIAGDEETLEIRLPARFARAAADSGIVLVCHPLIPSREGSSDRRRLGMPVVELEVKPEPEHPPPWPEAVRP
jgi:hypothetical protein